MVIFRHEIASRLNRTPHPAEQTGGKPLCGHEERWIKWSSLKNRTHSRSVSAETPVSKQKPPSSAVGDTACSSLNLCCVLQCSALLPWQKSPHSNNLFQGRLKRDSAHAQKSCTCSVSSLQRPFQREHHKGEREIRYWFFFLCWRGWLFSFTEDLAHICLCSQMHCCERPPWKPVVIVPCR